MKLKLVGTSESRKCGEGQDGMRQKDGHRIATDSRCAIPV